MLSKVRQALGYEVTIAELIGLGLIVGTPYLLVGTIRSTTHRPFAAYARRRPRGVVPRLDRVLVGAAVRERMHDMSAEAAGVPLIVVDTCIHITDRTACWDELPASVAAAAL
jgi:hypothetical protein